MKVLILIVFLIFFGCIQQDGNIQSCDRTLDCDVDEICKDNQCIVPECRLKGQTCDSSIDCCDSMQCENNYCVDKQCPENCSDSNECTKDSCNASTNYQCQHIAISCENDKKCIDGECKSLVLETIKKIENGSVNYCRQSLFNSWELKDYKNMEILSKECADIISGYIGELENLDNTINNSNETSILETKVLELKSIRQEIYFYKSFAETEQKRANLSENYEDIDYITDIKDASSHLEYATYYLYSIKNNYPNQWSGYRSEIFKEYSEKYRVLSAKVNEFYDEIGNHNYKYVFYVNADDPIVKELSDELTIGIEDRKKVKNTLFRYVIDNTNYTYDPLWGSDWIQPPVFTAIRGYGDCEDYTIFLASLFHRAGIESMLCDVDTDSNGITDHLVAATQDTSLHIYDAVNDVDGLDSEAYEFLYEYTVLNCYSVQETTLVPRCEDGTPYGQCSKENIPLFCDNGEWIANCAKCGCSQEFPYCSKSGAGCWGCLEGQTPITEYETCCLDGWTYDSESGFCYKRT